MGGYIMESKALLAALKYFNVHNNQLIVGGKPVSRWVQEYGTPLYLYDCSVIKKKIGIYGMFSAEK